MTGTHPQNRRLGYARVSTYGQTLDAQLEQLRGAGCTKIFREKVTGAHNDRRELLKMLAALAPDDSTTLKCNALLGSPLASIALCSRLRRIPVAQGVQPRDHGSKTPESGECWLNCRDLATVGFNRPVPRRGDKCLL
jgi:resolvase-like protein